jgi:hypothetical protein
MPRHRREPPSGCVAIRRPPHRDWRCRAGPGRGPRALPCPRRLVVHVVVAEQVQRAVHQQRARMVGQGSPSPRLAPRRSPRARTMSPSISSGPGVRRRRARRLGLREGEDVGRLVLAAPLGVERAHFLVAGQDDRQLDRARAAWPAAGKALSAMAARAAASAPSAPSRCYCPIPRRRRGDVEHHAPGPHKPRRSARRADGGRRRRR